MSYSLLDSVFTVKMTSGEKLVLVALIQRADRDTHGCWLLLSTLSSMTGRSDASVRRDLGLLRRRGYVSWDDRPGRSSVFKLGARRLLADAEAVRDSAPARPFGRRGPVSVSGAESPLTMSGVTPASPLTMSGVGIGTPLTMSGNPAHHEGSPLTMSDISPLYPLSETSERKVSEVLRPSPLAPRSPEAEPGARNPEPGRFSEANPGARNPEPGRSGEGGGGSFQEVLRSPEERAENLRRLAALGVAAVKPVSQRERCLAAHKDLPRFRSPFP